MTNDTNTLNGSLSELGESMASNLVAMGVTDADASDGLTTLANKILDISPTPVTQSLTLSSDKSILSYADSETCTLTATLSGGTVSGQTITFFDGTTSIGTATTDSNGVATKTYSSTGSGDVSLTAMKGNVVSQPVSIEDYLIYDTGQTDKSSKFEWGHKGSSPTISHNSNGYYQLYSPYTSDSTGGNTLYLATVPNNRNLEILFDFNTNYSGSPYNFVLKVWGVAEQWNDHLEIGTWSGSKILRLINDSGTSYSSNPSQRLGSGTWYTFSAKMENGQTVLKIMNGNSVVSSYTASDVLKSSTMTFGVVVQYNASTNYFRNIKVKAL